MLLKFLLCIVLSFNLLAKESLQKNYYIDTDEIKLSTIVANPKSDVLFFKFEKNRYTKRVKSKDLIRLLKSHGYNNFNSKNRYIKFIKKSPINLSKLEDEVRNLYKNKYKNINIKKISIEPRGYIKTIPQSYHINIQQKSHLSNYGTLYIKTPQRKKIFFDYYIDADVNVFLSRKNIKKDTELSMMNTLKKTILLDKFRAMPLQDIRRGTIQAKHHIKQNSVITLRDIEPLNIIKRDSSVNVNLSSRGISITFIAKALQDGKLNDIITIQKNDGKRLKARVVGKNRVEIR